MFKLVGKQSKLYHNPKNWTKKRAKKKKKKKICDKTAYVQSHQFTQALKFYTNMFVVIVIFSMSAAKLAN